jgi:hypothetical protein
MQQTARNALQHKAEACNMQQTARNALQHKAEACNMQQAARNALQHKAEACNMQQAARNAAATRNRPQALAALVTEMCDVPWSSATCAAMFQAPPYLSPGADVGGASPVLVQMWQG